MGCCYCPFDVCAYVCLIASGNRKCSGVAQLPRLGLCPVLIFYILNLPHFSGFQVFCLHIKVNNNNLSTFQTGKIHENFQYLFNEICGQFKKFPPRRRGPSRGLGGLYSIECPRIGGKKNYQFKAFFLPDKGSRGTSQKCALRAHFHARPVGNEQQRQKTKQNKTKKQTKKQTNKPPTSPVIRRLAYHC